MGHTLTVRLKVCLKRVMAKCTGVGRCGSWSLFRFLGGDGVGIGEEFRVY